MELIPRAPPLPLFTPFLLFFPDPLLLGLLTLLALAALLERRLAMLQVYPYIFYLFLLSMTIFTGIDPHVPLVWKDMGPNSNSRICRLVVIKEKVRVCTPRHIMVHVNNILGVSW